MRIIVARNDQVHVSVIVNIGKIGVAAGDFLKGLVIEFCEYPGSVIFVQDGIGVVQSTDNQHIEIAVPVDIGKVHRTAQYRKKHAVRLPGVAIRLTVVQVQSRSFIIDILTDTAGYDHIGIPVAVDIGKSKCA